MVIVVSFLFVFDARLTTRRLLLVVVLIETLSGLLEHELRAEGLGHEGLVAVLALLRQHLVRARVAQLVDQLLAQLLLWLYEVR